MVELGGHPRGRTFRKQTLIWSQNSSWAKRDFTHKPLHVHEIHAAGQRSKHEVWKKIDRFWIPFAEMETGQKKGLNQEETKENEHEFMGHDRGKKTGVVKRQSTFLYERDPGIGIFLFRPCGLFS